MVSLAISSGSAQESRVEITINRIPVRLSVTMVITVRFLFLERLAPVRRKRFISEWPFLCFFFDFILPSYRMASTGEILAAIRMGRSRAKTTVSSATAAAITYIQGFRRLTS